MYLKTNFISLPVKTYLNDIEPFKSSGIPSNSIVYKRVPGCGITTYQIRYAKQHSIIIEANVPVIKSKVKEHNNKYPTELVLGVHKGIDVNDIKAYLLNDDIQYKKIITTPEGFVTKVLKAFKDNTDTLINDYFLLYDECEKIITDVSYRGAIAAPLDIFFKFKHKALVSATPLPFSDERFKAFEYYEIVPDYDFSEPLTVIHTNSVIASLKSHLDVLKPEQVCIFLNSTSGIHAVIDALDIHAESKVFCSEDSVVKLLIKKYKHATSEFEVKDMAKFNFFTSRYFSAFDIILEHKPDVIVVSDIVFAKHSILDPQTEVIQIAGRLRKGISSLTHITNYNPELEVMTQPEKLSYLEGSLDLHEAILELLSTSKRQGKDAMLDFFTEHSPYAGFYTEGKRNTFMIDNALNEERVKMLYTNPELLTAAYENIDDHFCTTHLSNSHPVSDLDLQKYHSRQTVREQKQEAARMLYKLTPTLNHFVLLSETGMDLRNRLTKQHPVIAEAVRVIGLQKLEEIGYAESEIRKIVNAAHRQNAIARLAPFVHQAFNGHSSIEEPILITQLNTIASKNNYHYKVSASLISNYFKARRSGGKDGNKWILEHKLHPTYIQH